MINVENEFNLNINELLSQLTELMDDRPINSRQAYLFLLLLWGYFEVSILETNQEDESGTTTTTLTPNIIQIENGYQLFDYGMQFKTSRGNCYGSYSTARLFTTIKAIIDRLVQRDAKQVQFHGLDVAKRFAWVECEKNNIRVMNFTPDNKEKLLQYRFNARI